MLAKLHKDKRDTARRFKPHPIRPGRDWLIGLLFFTALFAGGSVASGLMFMRYSTITIDTDAAEVHMPRYNQKQIDEAIQTFTARKTTYDQATNNTVTTPPQTVPIIPATSTSTATSTPPTPVVPVDAPVIEGTIILE